MAAQPIDPIFRVLKPSSNAPKQPVDHSRMNIRIATNLGRAEAESLLRKTLGSDNVDYIDYYKFAEESLYGFTTVQWMQKLRYYTQMRSYLVDLTICRSAEIYDYTLETVTSTPDGGRIQTNTFKGMNWDELKVSIRHEIIVALGAENPKLMKP